MAPLVTLIVPVYNVARYLKRCLDSLFAQTYPNLSIIVVDDGSSDGSGRLLDDLCSSRPNIFVIHKPNGGLASARNAGLDQADLSDESFIMFVDSDDYIENDYVEFMVSLAEKHEADIVCSDFDGFNGRFCGATKLKLSLRSKEVLNAPQALLRLFNGDIQSHLPTKLFKSWLWRRTRFDENTRFMEDQKLTYRLFYDAKSIVYTDYRGYNYFYGPNSLVRSSFDNRKVVEALTNYFDAVAFPFSFESALANQSVHDSAETLFASAYLMLLPRFKWKTATQEERASFREFSRYVRENKLILKAHFPRKKDRNKRTVYLLSKRLYILLYRIMIHMKGRN